MSAPYGGSVTGYNNIIYFNTADANPNVNGTVSLNYSSCAQQLSGTGNITGDPLFVNSYNGDFNLQQESPCIDTGDPDSAPDPDGTIADMGALYFDQTVYAPQIELSVIELVFDSTMVEETDTLRVTISNTGNSDLIIYDIFCAHPDIFTLDWNSADTLITPAGELELEVIFSPAEAMQYEDEITIENNDQDVWVSLTGQGAALSAVRGYSQTPLVFDLDEPYPNPFNPETTLNYDIAEPGNVSLTVYDVQGRVAAEIIDGWHSPGNYTLKFDGRNLSSGIYFAALSTHGQTTTEKLLLIK